MSKYKREKKTLQIVDISMLNTMKNKRIIILNVNNVTAIIKIPIIERIR